MNKVRVILHGCCGAMGTVITRLASEDARVQIVAGIDICQGTPDPGYPVYAHWQECRQEADVIVDFSVAAAADSVMDFAEERRLPLVLCTTGLSETQLERLKSLSEKIAVLRSANMSLGVNTLLVLAARAAQILADQGYDMEIIEQHHNKKLDAPSGTAIAIADAIREAIDGEYTYRYDRSSIRARRDPREIGIQSVRGGTIVGVHELLFCGTDEVLEIKHTAYSKAIFGKGAISAAIYMAGKTSGYYTMADVIGEE